MDKKRSEEQRKGKRFEALYACIKFSNNKKVSKLNTTMVFRIGAIES